MSKKKEESKYEIGDTVINTGRIFSRSWRNYGEIGDSIRIETATVKCNLSRSCSYFSKKHRSLDLFLRAEKSRWKTRYAADPLGLKKKKSLGRTVLFTWQTSILIFTSISDIYAHMSFARSIVRHLQFTKACFAAIFILGVDDQIRRIRCVDLCHAS